MEIILVLQLERIKIWKELVARHRSNVPHKIIAGGKERFHSAKNALATICDNDEALIGIHDGVRPFVSQELILRAYSEAIQFGAVVSVMPKVNPIRLHKIGDL